MTDLSNEELDDATFKETQNKLNKYLTIEEKDTNKLTNDEITNIHQNNRLLTSDEENDEFESKSLKEKIREINKEIDFSILSKLNIFDHRIKGIECEIFKENVKKDHFKVSLQN